jgi:hypothetical protein
LTAKQPDALPRHFLLSESLFLWVWSARIFREDKAMLTPMKRYGIRLLRQANVPQERIAAIMSCNVRTVRRVEKEKEVSAFIDKVEVLKHGIGRPSKAEEFRIILEKILEDEPGLLGVEIFVRLKEASYTGGKSAFYELLKTLIKPSVELISRFEGLPGEFSQHDFGEVEVRFLDGRKKKIEFFASRLKYSRFICVNITKNHRVESLVRALACHFEIFGGLPLRCVFDRPTSVVLRWKKDLNPTRWNDVFKHALFDLGVVVEDPEGSSVELCTPGRGQEKGSVENLVKWVKNSFFKQRRFVDEKDLEMQLHEWLRKVNYETPSRATGVIPAEKLEEEKRRFRSLKTQSADLALRVPGYVGPTAYVSFEGKLFSMPPSSISTPATIFVYEKTIRIEAGDARAEHPRDCEGRSTSTHPEHRQCS